MSKTEVLGILKPKPCPYPLIRIGGKSDGAYLVPDDLEGIDSCFSPGVCNSKRFEDHLAKEYAIKSYMCDFSSDEDKFETKIIPGLQFFRKKWLDLPGAENSISLDDWIDLDCPYTEKDLMLQMDIEGAEYRNLLSAKVETLNRFRIILIEFHQLPKLISNSEYEEYLEPVLRKLNLTHTCVHAHPNNCCGDVLDRSTGMNIPRVIEITFLRNDRFEVSGKKLIVPRLPHPKDISINTPHNTPLYLNDKWLTHGSNYRMRRVKIAQDRIVWVAKHLLSRIKNKIRTN